jgi:hypothetical protein
MLLAWFQTKSLSDADVLVPVYNHTPACHLCCCLLDALFANSRVVFRPQVFAMEQTGFIAAAYIVMRCDLC